MGGISERRGSLDAFLFVGDLRFDEADFGEECESVIIQGITKKKMKNGS